MTHEEPIPVWAQTGPHYWNICYIQAPRAKVFEYLTRGELTSQYYFGMPINDPTKAGQRVWYGPSEEGAPIVGEVLEWNPPEQFVHTFSFSHHPDEQPSIVDFTLYEDAPDLTGLVLRHHGFPSGDSGTLHDVSAGWPQILSNLKTLLETGKPLEWPASPEQ